MKRPPIIQETMESKYRYLIPNGITFISLTCGTIAILLATRNMLWGAGTLIMVSYVLDMFDGASARKLKAGSEFGLQLDSLTDMVSLGVAPAVLAYMHLETRGLNMAIVCPLVIFLPLAGAFRLARFNLLPPKENSKTDSMGLPISTGGAIVALAVLSELTWPERFIPGYILLPLIAGICVLEVSKIAFPSVGWVFNGPKRTAVLLTLFLASLIAMPFFYAWFIWTNAYLGVGLARAGIRRLGR